MSWGLLLGDIILDPIDVRHILLARCWALALSLALTPSHLPMSSFLLCRILLAEPSKPDLVGCHTHQRCGCLAINSLINSLQV